MIYVRTPTDEEFQELKRMTRQEIGRVAQRAQMILLSAQQRTVPEIAGIFAVEYKTVRKWLRRFNAAGPAGLYDEPRSGRPRKSLSENLKELESKTPSAINGVITTQPYGGASCRNILSQNLRPSTTSKCRGACGALSRSICRLKPHQDPVVAGGGLVIGPS